MTVMTVPSFPYPCFHVVSLCMYLKQNILFGEEDKMYCVINSNLRFQFINRTFSLFLTRHFTFMLIILDCSHLKKNLILRNFKCTQSSTALIV